RIIRLGFQLRMTGQLMCKCRWKRLNELINPFGSTLGDFQFNMTTIKVIGGSYGFQVAVSECNPLSASD
ncbi:hypothetical protein NPIL_13761, partial [Nephila pilipes]